jgi:two-component system, OmpR family, sensor histidine kinase MprB
VSFRLRQTLVTALAVAAAVAIACALVYVLVRGELRGQVEDTLRERAAFVTHGPLEIQTDPGTGELLLHLPRRGPGLEPGGVFVQAVNEEGSVARPDLDQAAFPVSEQTLEVARGERKEFLSDATVDGTHVRMLTVPVGQGFALQLVRPLDEVDQLLDRIGLAMIFVAVGGIGAAAILGALVARTALAPVRRLTREAEVVTETQDLGHRIELHGSDELARLGASFNTMLAALEESQQAQRRLVADASHELRTPLTSLRTNIEVLARRRDLPEEKREALLNDLVGQLEEMSLLVTNLVELASERPTELEPTEVQLDVLTEEAVARAQRLAPQVSFHTSLQESIVHGIPSRLERAIANLLDNAVKWSPPAGDVEVGVADHEVTVRDHGPGIDESDVPFVFDRFYRAPSARSLPGFGLGLALVRQVADEHGATIVIERPVGGGTLVRLKLPEAEAVEHGESRGDH